MIALIAGAVISQQTSPTLDAVPELTGLKARWESAMQDWQIPGMAIAIVKDGRVLVVEGLGRRSPFADEPATPDTMFYIASITKTYTGLAIACLAEEGKLNLDDPVVKHLPQFVLADVEAAKKITIRDLLCHRPGLNSGPAVLLDAYTGEITDERFFKLMAKETPAGEVDYTNVHFTLLGRVIEAVTGQKWQDYLQTRLFDRAGMTRTTAYASRMYADGNSAVPTEPTAAGAAMAQPIKTDRTMHAAGGLGTTARDLAVYMRLMLGDGQVDGRRVALAATIRSMLTRQSDYEPQGQIRRLSGFGLGWNLGTYRGKPLASHGGGYTGASAYVSLLPEHGLGVAVLVNSGMVGGALMDVVAVDVTDRLLGLEPQDLMGGYDQRVKERLEQIKQAGPIGPNPAMSPLLSVKPSACTGVYANDLMGTVTIDYVDGQLEFRFGDLRQALQATAKNEFLAKTDWRDSGTRCRLITAGERVTAIDVEFDEGEPVRFERA